MSIFFLVLSLVVLIVAFVLPAKGDYVDFRVFKRIAKVISPIVMVVSILVAGFYIVPAGHRGVLVNAGAVGGVMGEGPHFVVPFYQRVELIEVRTQKEESKVAAASKDLQNVSTTIATNYHLEKNRVANLYQSVGPDFANKIIDPVVQESAKSVMANYTAEELIRVRSKVKTEIDAMITSRLAAYDIIVEANGVNLTNFDFSQEFNTAIEQKQVAQQSAEKSKYELQKAEIDAKTALAKATGEAQSNRIKATALNQSGGSKVLAREWIEKWDGRLPTVISGDSGMMFNMESLMKESQEK